MTADSDYARVIHTLARQRLPTYVSYVDSLTLNGFHETNGGAPSPQRITVDTRSGKIISGTPQRIKIGGPKSAESSNPVLRPAFDPRCYRATSEERASYNGADALLFELTPTCGTRDNYPFAQLYADRSTWQPLAATGTFFDREARGGANVGIEQRYGTFGGYVLPALLNVDVKGTGLAFWVNVHAEERYESYRFSPTR